MTNIKFLTKCIALVSLSSLSLVSVASFAQANKQTNAQTGFTGLLRIPNADVVDYGDLNLSYAFEKNVKTEGGNFNSYAVGAHHTVLLNIGFLSGLEISVQNTHKRINGTEPGYNKGGGSDLSFSAKLSSEPWLPNLPVKFALGIQDFSKRTIQFHANKYVVASTKLHDNIEVVAGYGQSENRNQMGKEYLDGFFAGARYDLTPHVQLLTDYDGTGVNAGVAASYNPDFLPKGWYIQGKAQLYSGSETLNRDNAYAMLALNIPMFGDVTLPDAPSILEPAALKASKGYQKAKKRQLANPYAQSTKFTNINGLSKQDADIENSYHITSTLRAIGFENVRLGHYKGSTVITYENNVFLRSQLKGMAVAMQAILNNTANIKQPIKLVLLSNNQPMLMAEFNSQRVKQGLNNNLSLANLINFSWGSQTQLNETKWITANLRASKFVPRLQLSPHLNSSIGTEFGVVDYTLGLASNLTMDLWQGSALDIRYILPLIESDDVGFAGHPVQPLKSGIDRALIHQSLKINDNTTSQLSAGLIRYDLLGGTSETAWHSETGQHKVNGSFGYYQDKDNSKVDYTIFNLGYRYYLPSFKHGILVNASRVNGENAYALTLRNWYNNIAIDMTFDRQPNDSNYAGLTFTLPLTLEKSMIPNQLQVTGEREWRYGYRTKVGVTDNNVQTDVASGFNLQHNLDRVYYDRDRLSPKYFEANLAKLAHLMTK